MAAAALVIPRGRASIILVFKTCIFYIVEGKYSIIFTSFINQNPHQIKCTRHRMTSCRCSSAIELNELEFLHKRFEQMNARQMRPLNQSNLLSESSGVRCFSCMTMDLPLQTQPHQMTSTDA